VALIAVGPDGENQISVAPGANVELDGARVVAALRAIEPNVVLCSLEVGRSAADAALSWARDHGVAAILNPAPWQPWARALIGTGTIVTPNEAEREALGSIPEGIVVIETRGAAGAVIHDAGGDRSVPAPAVEATDTTGAGDCFNGVLAAAILEGRPVDEAVRAAVVAAALSTTVPGAREGLPDRDAIAHARARSGI
jgi:ribokinase